MVIFLPRPPILAKLLQYLLTRLRRTRSVVVFNLRGVHRQDLKATSCLGTPIGEAWGVDFYLNVIKMGYFMEEARFERANYIEI